MDKSTVEILRGVAPFDTLGKDVLEEIAPLLQLQYYDKGSYVFRQGEPSLGMLFVLVKGLAEVTVTQERGVESVVGFRRPGDFFGETAFLTGNTYSGSVRARENLTCLLIPRDVFENLMDNHLPIARFFDRVLLDRMRSLYEEIVHEQSYDAYGTPESIIFRRRISELMTSPVVTCSPADPVSEVAGTMISRNISAVIVVNEAGEPLGLITEKGLVARLIAEPRNVQNCRAETVMDTHLVTLPPQAYLHQALLAVIKEGVKHLAVVEEQKLVGIVTLMDLVKARSTGTLWVVRNIETQHTLEGLQEIGREVDLLLNALVVEKAPVPVLFEIMSEMHGRLTRQVIALCEEQMEKEGHGPPPVPYCWLNMGSAGRCEQTLRTDQDNAIVYADPPAEQAPAIAEYFLRLGEKVVEGLSRCGFTKCKGNVMASNPAWCRSIQEWRKRIDHWIRYLDPSEVRTLTILLDFRPVYGETILGQSLWQQVFASLSGSPRALHMLAGDELQHRPPLGFRGNFITEKSGPHRDEINLKTSAATHIVNCLRIFAMQYGITETSTLDRLQELVSKGAIDRDEVEYIQAAFETVMTFRIRENLRRHQLGREPDDYINPSHLSKREQDILKDALSVIARLQKLTGKYFNTPW